MRNLIALFLLAFVLSVSAATKPYTVMSDTNGVLLGPSTNIWSANSNVWISLIPVTGGGVALADFQTATNQIQTNLNYKADTNWVASEIQAATNGLGGSGLTEAQVNTLVTNNYLSLAATNIVIPYAFPLASTNTLIPTNYLSTIFAITNYLAPTNVYATTNWVGNTFLNTNVANTLIANATNFLANTNVYAPTNWVGETMFAKANTNALKAELTNYVGTVSNAIIGVVTNQANIIVTNNVRYIDAGYPASVSDQTNYVFDANIGFKSITLTNDFCFANSTNLQSGLFSTVIFRAGGTARNISFPTGWNWYGVTNNPPTAIAANKQGILSIVVDGIYETNIHAGFSHKQ